MKKTLTIISVLSTVLCACGDLVFEGDIQDMDGNPFTKANPDETCTENKTSCDGKTLITCVTGKAKVTKECDVRCGEDPNQRGTFKCITQDDICTKDYISCDGNSLVTCVTGQMPSDTSCGEDKTCGEDPDNPGSFKCLEKKTDCGTHRNGDSWCNLNTLHTCKDGIESTTPCGDSKTCKQVSGKEGVYQCQPNPPAACTEDGTWCEDNVFVRCNSGVKNAVNCGDNKTCGEDPEKPGTFKCLEKNADCGEHKDGESWCDSNTLHICQNSIENTNDCGDDQECGPNPEKPGTYACIDNSPVEDCTEDKTECVDDSTLVTCIQGQKPQTKDCSDNEICGPDPEQEGAFKCLENEASCGSHLDGSNWCDTSTNTLFVCKEGKEMDTSCGDDQICGKDPQNSDNNICQSICINDFDGYKLNNSHTCICDAFKYDAIQDKTKCKAWGVVISSKNINSLQESLKQNLCSDIKYIKLKDTIQFPTASDKILFLNNCKILENTVLIGENATITAYPRFPMFQEIKGSIINDIKIEINSKGTKALGIIANSVINSTIKSIHYSGSFATEANSVGDSVGGLFGKIASSTNIEDVSFSGSFTAENATNNIGGIAGTVDNSTLQNIVFEKGIYATNGKSNIGGIAGQISNSTIMNAHFHGRLEAKQADINININNDQTGEETIVIGGNVGGIAGFAENTVFNNIYVRGTDNEGVDIITNTGEDVGGLIGEMKGGSITNDCNTNRSIIKTLTGTRNIGGVIGAVNNGPKTETVIHGVSIDVTNIKANTRTNGCNSSCCACVTGGFLGYGARVSVSQCAVKTNNIIGRNYIGGFAGEIESFDSNSIEYISNTVTNITTATNQNIGGFIGILILKADNDGAIVTIDHIDNHIGQMNAQVTGATGIGGFIGFISYQNKKDNYALNISNSISMVDRIIANDPNNKCSRTGGFLGVIGPSSNSLNTQTNISNIFTGARLCSIDRVDTSVIYEADDCGTCSGGFIFRPEVSERNALNLNNIVSASYRLKKYRDNMENISSNNHGSYKYIVGMVDYESALTFIDSMNAGNFYYYAFNGQSSFPYSDGSFKEYFKKFLKFNTNGEEGKYVDSTQNVINKLDATKWASKCLDESHWSITNDSGQCSIKVPYPKLDGFKCTIP